MLLGVLSSASPSKVFFRCGRIFELHCPLPFAGHTGNLATTYFVRGSLVLRLEFLSAFSSSSFGTDCSLHTRIFFWNGFDIKPSCHSLRPKPKKNIDTGICVLGTLARPMGNSLIMEQLCVRLDRFIYVCMDGLRNTDREIEST